MPLSAFSNQTLSSAWLTDDLTSNGLFDEDLITAQVATGPVVVPGAGSDTLTGRAPIMAFAIVMPPES